MRKVITLEQAMNARPIAEPLNLFDCSLISDGAAAVVLCAADRARDFTDKPVKILGSGQASDYDDKSMLVLRVGILFKRAPDRVIMTSFARTRSQRQQVSRTTDASG